jgi:hypothetical protein
LVRWTNSLAVPVLLIIALLLASHAASHAGETSVKVTDYDSDFYLFSSQPNSSALFGERRNYLLATGMHSGNRSEDFAVDLGIRPYDEGVFAMLGSFYNAPVGNSAFRAEFGYGLVMADRAFGSLSLCAIETWDSEEGKTYIGTGLSSGRLPPQGFGAAFALRGFWELESDSLRLTGDLDLQYKVSDWFVWGSEISYYEIIGGQEHSISRHRPTSNENLTWGYNIIEMRKVALGFFLGYFVKSNFLVKTGFDFTFYHDQFEVFLENEGEQARYSGRKETFSFPSYPPLFLGLEFGL